MKKLLALTAALALAGSAHADLKNISANGLHSSAQEFVACTIVDEGTTLLGGGVLLYVFAETGGNGDPTIRVWSLHRDIAVINDNWQDGMDFHAAGETAHLSPWDSNGESIYTTLRNPRATTDSAVSYPALPGEAVCAESRDKTSGELLPVSISITDMNAIVFLKHSPSIAKSALSPSISDVMESITGALLHLQP